jgi:hypothetical protein
MLWKNPYFYKTEAINARITINFLISRGGIMSYIIPSYTGQPRPQHGVHETYRSVSDFASIDAYFEKWIVPNIFGDLDTVFMGAQQFWGHKKQTPGAAGRGDFSLAIALLAAMEHLGCFLAPGLDDAITTGNNIGRTAQCLQSTWDIFAIVASLGRNAVVHAGWPQTAIAMPPDARPTWAFGLSFNASENPLRHDTVHFDTIRRSQLFDPTKPAHAADENLLMVKLVLNVQMLRWELLEFKDSGEFLRLAKVEPKTFKRIQDMSRVSGVPWNSQMAERSSLETSSGSKAIKTKTKAKESDLALQIERVRREAERLNPQILENRSKFRRDHRG